MILTTANIPHFKACFFNYYYKFVYILPFFALMFPPL